MKYVNLLTLTIGIYSSIPLVTASYNIDDIDKDKPVWTDHTLQLYHQFFLMEAFRPLNAGLCEIENSGYENWINLNIVGDPVTKVIPADFNPDDNSEDIFNISYKAGINQRDCGVNENNYAHIVKAYQENSSEPLYINTYNKNGSVSTAGRELIIKNETSESNPYGEIEHSYSLFGHLSNKGLYQANTRSEINENNTEVTVESMSLVDFILLNPNIPAGLINEMYSSTIVHEIGGNGYGTITSFAWGQINISLASMTDTNGDPLTHGYYPDGIPDIVRTTNFAYDDNFLVYSSKESQAPSSPYYTVPTVTFDDICLSRDQYWTYVPDNLGYGVYDESGNRVSDNSNISINFSIDVEGYGLWTGLLSLSGTGLNIPYVCKDANDGSIVTNDLCNNNAYGYEFFPLFDVPDGTVLSNGDDHYYVRQLKPRITFSVVELTNCSGLEIQPTIQTPDHKEFEYVESIIPPSGAILFNQYQNNPEFDPIYNGIVYISNEDTDGDGVLNFLDAYPDDASKSKDDDYDGIEDSSDTELLQAIPSWDKHEDKDLFDNYDH